MQQVTCDITLAKAYSDYNATRDLFSTIRKLELSALTLDAIERAHAISKVN